MRGFVAFTSGRVDEVVAGDCATLGREAHGYRRPAARTIRRERDFISRHLF
jgi:hypothetical protein